MIAAARHANIQPSEFEEMHYLEAGYVAARASKQAHDDWQLEQEAHNARAHGVMKVTAAAAGARLV
jgi:hypothetical protein